MDVQSIPFPFEHSQTMKFTQQHKLIGLAFHSTCTTFRLWPLVRVVRPTEMVLKLFLRLALRSKAIWAGACFPAALLWGAKLMDISVRLSGVLCPHSLAIHLYIMYGISIIAICRR